MKTRFQILLADDEPLFGQTTKQFLELHELDVTFVENASLALQAMASKHFDLVIADLDMPGNRNLEFLNTGRTSYPSVPFVLVTGRPTLPSAIECIRLGVHDYFLKPLELDDLLHSIHRALPSNNLRVSAEHEFSELLGDSDAMKGTKDLALRVAKSNATVLIRGESGTGKELLARGIHDHSQRANGPFITVDCASIPESLLESTLFGHSRGAFTGAVADHIGLVAAAEGGSLFLDEIGELPLSMQAKLLRVLQFGTFVPVGSIQEKKVDVRILAATNRDLSFEVERSHFRLDLYYRLSVLEIKLPPLRERQQDVIKLAQHFLTLIAKRDGTERRFMSAAANALLCQHSWPGNVRELQSTMERCACLTNSSEITADVLQNSLLRGESPANHVPLDQVSAATTHTMQDYVAANEKMYIETLLKRHKGNISRAARDAKMSRQGMHKAITRLGITSAEFRTP